MKFVPEKLPDSPLQGPSTVMWLLGHMKDNGGGPVAFHHRWMSEVRLDYGATGVSDHLTWCQLLEYMINYDFLDPAALAAGELASRKLQMIHDRWKHKLPTLAGAGADNIEDDAFIIMGTHETHGNVGMCPALQTWLGEIVSKETMAAKERRKAREERALAPKAAAKK